MALENEWGGRYSAQKSQQLVQILFHALTQSEDSREKLMFMQEECAEGNFNSIKILKETNAPSLSYVKQALSDDEDDSCGNDHDGDISTEIRVDAPDSSLNEEDMMIDEPSPQEVAEVEAGWTVVTSKRNKGRRN